MASSRVLWSARRVVAAWAVAAAVLLLALPGATRLGRAVTATRFLGEFLSEGARPWLSGVTPAPTREPRALPGGAAADRWAPGGEPIRGGAVLVHGLTPAGKDDPRLAQAADLLARAGLVVLAPDLPAMRSERLRPDDAAVVRSAIAALGEERPGGGAGLAVVSVSVGAAPALAAAADPAVARAVRLVVVLGGYAEARELVRYFTTGAFAFGAVTGRVPVNPALARAFLAANLDLVRDPLERRALAAALEGQPLPHAAGPEARAVLAVLENRDPARVDALLAALPPPTRALLDALSPARDAPRLRARLTLVHGRDDAAIPVTESLRLAAAAPGPSRVLIVDPVGHVEGRTTTWRSAWDLARLWSVVYDLLGD